MNLVLRLAVLGILTLPISIAMRQGADRAERVSDATVGKITAEDGRMIRDARLARR